MRRRALPPPAAPPPPMWPSFRGSISTRWTISTACLPLWLPPPRAPDPVAAAAQDIEASVEKLVAPEGPQAPEDAEDTLDLSGGTARVEVPVQEKDGGLYAELLELNLNPAEGERAKRPVRTPLEEADVPEEPAEPTRRIDFDHLQFGRDYEIK